MQPAYPLLPPEQRRALLQTAVMGEIAQGARIESQADFHVVMLKGGQANNVLHGILTLLTCGLWLIVWLIIAITNKPRRFQLWVDDFGQVGKTMGVPSPPAR